MKNKAIALAAAVTITAGLAPTLASADQVPGDNGRLLFWYMTPETNCRSLASMEADGTDLQVLVDCTDSSDVIQGQVGHADWSPDGNSVVVVHYDSGKLYRADADGGNQTEFQYDVGGTPTSFARVWNVEWASDDVLWGCDNDSSDTLQKFTISTGVRETWVQDACWNVDVSPDGTTLVFHDNANVFTAPVSDPSDYTDITPNYAGDVRHTSWSPDGTRIILQARDEGIYIASIPADGSADPTPIVLPGAINEDPHSPMMSPDGTKIAFLGGTTKDIWVADADGSNPVNIFEAVGLGASQAGALQWYSIPSENDGLPTTGAGTTTLLVAGLMAAAAGAVALRARRTA